jgi:YidC/Oxa1 family membrane protein insertase
MDKQTTLGFILIAIVLIVWMWLQAPPQPTPQQKATADSIRTAELSRKDSIAAQEAKEEKKEEEKAAAVRTEPEDSLGTYFSHLASGQEKILLIRTDLYTAEITTYGGLVRKWELKNYTTWNGYPVPLVDYGQGGDYSLLFTSKDGKLINTRNLYFRSDYRNWKTIELHGDDSFTAELVLPVDDHRRIVKKFTFSNGKYSFDSDIRFENMQEVVANFEYQVTWEHGVPYAERNSVNESGYAKAYAYAGGELSEIDASSVGEPEKKDFTGSTDWVATRNKYFAAALLPDESSAQGAYMWGDRFALPDHGARETYSLALKMPFKGSSLEESKVTVFLGPLDFDVVTSYNRHLDQIMSLGAAWIIRPISEYVLLPMFAFLKMIIPNFGVVIIIFSIIIKIALHPLSKTSMKSMKKMQALQPMMQEIREKYKDDPQKMNQHVMNLYKDYGVNPAAGCLPLLLQMPILYALYSVFSSSIELRQAGFFWWITDLSVPDVLIHLPFNLPILGTSELSGLALAMGITMFLQQKMTVTDPRQKAMVYFMPIMMTLLFNSFPAGLNLYYFVFNLLSIGQQMYVNKQHEQEPLKKIDPKKRKMGFLERLAKDMPKTR